MVINYFVFKYFDVFYRSLLSTFWQRAVICTTFKNENKAIFILNLGFFMSFTFIKCIFHRGHSHQNIIFFLNLNQKIVKEFLKIMK